MKQILSLVSKNELEEIKKYLKNQGMSGNTVIVTPEGAAEFIAFWRVTHGCNIGCRYCKVSSSSNSEEITLDERLGVIKKIAEITDEMDLSGG